MLKGRYEKPVVKPADRENALAREEYRKPDMEVLELGATTVIYTRVTTTGTGFETSAAVTSTAAATTTAAVIATTVAPVATTSAYLVSGAGH